MKVVVDATMLDGQPSGAHTRLAALGAEHARAQRVDVVYLVRPGCDPLPGLECVPFERFDTPFRRARSGARLRRALAELNADVFAAGALPLPANVGVPIVLTLHDLRFLDESTGAPWWRRVWARGRLRPNLARACRVVAVSQTTADDIVRRGLFSRECIDVVPNAPTPDLEAVDDPQLLAAFRRRAGLNSRYVLAIGPLEPHKNLGWMLDVLAAVRKRPAGSDVALVLAGRAEPEAALVVGRRAKRIGVDEAVRVTGCLTQDELAVALTGADALFAAGRREGFAIPVVDAQRIGVPVVALRAGALPEVCGAGGWLVGDDVESAADALIAAITPVGARDRVLAAAVDAVARWSWADSAHTLEAAWAWGTGPRIQKKSHAS